MDSLPRPFDPARAARTFEALEGVAPTPLLEAAFGNSPFLARLALREPGVVARFCSEGPEAIVEAARALALAAGEAPEIGEAMAALRQAKRHIALAVALADIGGTWTLERVTQELTRFADAAMKGSLRFALRQAADSAGQPLCDLETLEATCGLVVLAMGKQGGFELNYSSDIDFVVFYDEGKFPFRKHDEPRPAAVDIVKLVIKLLSQETDGYVFRADLRLRPDSRSTQVAISLSAAELYYEEMGQSWERAAMIKARPCAGDLHVGAQFLKATIEPFVWRRNLDFAAIEDIHSIKRQIHAFEGHQRIAVAGHNIKLGRGGIREIEFIVQTRQLVFGGRNPKLRRAGTIAALEELSKAQLIHPVQAADLITSYRYLRKLEHRLQMIDDQQTHTLPEDGEQLTHVAYFMSYDDVESFSADLTTHLKTVQGYYVGLFEQDLLSAEAQNNLVFTGVEDDPETLSALEEMGFHDASHVVDRVRGWHSGHIRATRSARARELLPKLMPSLLKALADSADPDAAFARFDRFLSNHPAGVQLFSLFLKRPHLLTDIANIAGSSPVLAEHLTRAPGTLNALFDPGYFRPLPSPEELDDALLGHLASIDDKESKSDAVRRFAKEQIFRAGAQISRLEDPEAIGQVFTTIAERAVGALLPIVENEFAERAGFVPGGRFAIIAMGRFGSREMTATSDLDLIFVYDVDDIEVQSDGEYPMQAATYYARLSQRLIFELTTLTVAGRLYETDMRLRPSGAPGPIAVTLERFRNYHKKEAWTYEHLALTRARTVAGSKELRHEIEEAIRAKLTMKRDSASIIADALKMRELVAEHFPARSCWNLKYAPGGLVDIDFIAQTLQLCTAAEQPDVLAVKTVDALAALARAGALPPDDCMLLIAAASLQNRLLQMLRVYVDGAFEPKKATEGLRNLLASADKAANFVALEDRLTDLQTKARAVFDRVFSP